MLLASTIQGIAQSAGLVDTGLDRASFLVQVNRCLRVVLDPITLPSPLNIGTSKSLDARAQAVFSGTPNPQSVPFNFTVTATRAGVQNPEGFSDADGRYTTVFTPSASAPIFTDLLKSFVANRIKNFLKPNIMIWINRIIGLILMGFGLQMIFSVIS